MSEGVSVGAVMSGISVGMSVGMSVGTSDGGAEGAEGCSPGRGVPAGAAGLGVAEVAVAVGGVPVTVGACAELTMTPRN